MNAKLNLIRNLVMYCMSFAVFEAVKAVDFHLTENEVLAFRLKRGEKVWKFSRVAWKLNATARMNQDSHNLE